MIYDEIYDETLGKRVQKFCILVEHGLRKEIMEKLNTTYPTVNKALNYRVNTLLAKKIRHYALTHGSVFAEKLCDNVLMNNGQCTMYNAQLMVMTGG